MNHNVFECLSVFDVHWCHHVFQLNERKADPVLLIFFRFVVRDFQYNEEEMKADKEEMTRLSTDKKKQFVCMQLSKFYSLLNIIKSSTMMLMSYRKTHQPHSQLDEALGLD